MQILCVLIFFLVRIKQIPQKFDNDVEIMFRLTEMGLRYWQNCLKVVLSYLVGGGATPVLAAGNPISGRGGGGGGTPLWTDKLKL